jgi:hypothetical protein
MTFDERSKIYVFEFQSHGLKGLTSSSTAKNQEGLIEKRSVLFYGERQGDYGT